MALIPFLGDASINNLLLGYRTTATATTTTTLIASSAYQQFFTGTLTQNCVMPVVSALDLGKSWYIVNNSTGNVTVQSSGGQTIYLLTTGQAVFVTCILLTGTTEASWSYNLLTKVAGITAGSADTLTNKTMTATSNVLGGVTMTLGSDATGDIWYRNSSGYLTRLAIGSSTQVLTVTSGLPSWAAAAGGSSGMTVNPQTASYTAVIGDANCLVTMSNASANNFTVPPNSSVAFTTGTTIIVSQIGAGATTLVAGSGVTLSSPNGLVVYTQYSCVSLIKIATDTWLVSGDTKA